MSSNVTWLWLLETHLIALAVVFQTTGPFAVAAFAVSPVWLALFAFTDFWFEGLWVSVEACLQKHI